MAKVYIINNMTHDYSSAEKFGELVNVTEGKMPIFKTDAMKVILEEALSRFTKDDYLLISGPTLMCIMAYQAAVKAINSVGTEPGLVIKLLVFDAKEQSYIVRHINGSY